MYGSFYNPDDKAISFQFNNSFQRMEEIYKAFVNAIIPRTPELAEEFGRIQYYGALDLYTDEYLILTLNSYYIPLAAPTAELLEAAAKQLVYMEGESIILDDKYNGSVFETLTPPDQIRALSLIQLLMINIVDLPLLYQNNPGYILYITNLLNIFTLMGYYSEWSGYGTTRMESPNRRILEYYPLSWEQVGYPGPSLGYRALKTNNSL